MGFVDLFGCGDIIVDQPQRLAPHCLKQSVSDMRVDFGFDYQRTKPNACERVTCGRDKTFVCRTRHHFDQRQKVDGIERVRDKEPVRRRKPCPQFGRFKARGGRPDGNGPVCSFDFGVDAMLEIQPFRDTFLHVIRVGHGIGNRVCEGKGAFGRQRGFVQHRQGVARVFQYFINLALSLWIGVIDRHIPSIQQKPRSPAAAYDTASEYRCFHVWLSFLLAKNVECRTAVGKCLVVAAGILDHYAIPWQ